MVKALMKKEDGELFECYRRDFDPQAIVQVKVGPNITKNPVELLIY